MVKYHIQIGLLRVQPFSVFANDLGNFFFTAPPPNGRRFSRMFELLRARLLFVPTLGWNVALGRLLKIRHWWDEIEPPVILGALPFASDVPTLGQLGVTAVVNTCEESSGPVAAYEKLGIRQLRLPTVDFTHPTLADLKKGVEFIDSVLQNGGKVYVHCKAGRGRSATLVACWLMAARGMTRYQAQQRLSQRRPHVNPRIAERPAVIEFERQLRGAGLRHSPTQPPETP